MGFPTKTDHFGVFGGYHHLREHPCTFHFLGVGLSSGVNSLFEGHQTGRPPIAPKGNSFKNQPTNGFRCKFVRCLSGLWATWESLIRSLEGGNPVIPMGFLAVLTDSVKSWDFLRKFRPNFCCGNKSTI